MNASPISGTEWTPGDINGLAVGVRCVDCSPNNRATQVQAKVDAVYNAEFALEVRFAWSGVSQLGQSTFLLVECQRLAPGSENALVQIGQGGPSPTAWRTVTTCISDTDQWYDPFPLNETEVNGGFPVVRLWDAQADTPDDTVQGTAAVDVLRIDVHVPPTLPEGSVDSMYRSPGVVNETIANGDFPPVAIAYSDRVVYLTRDGNYSFPLTASHLLELTDQGGFRQIAASGFFVDSTPPSTVANSTIGTWTDTLFVRCPRP
jgi:hypothetical protein